ncbi:UDP-GalNAc:beta-1,3-N-acetylgalactosaminyltransferase 1-like [Argopecten irradians]|uniref:UDP-GalNAc:beta-1, 3-N-acetylgalactosaminyltransferase 1-like n=1 Tax=Argopecten irradians TaxID=31199 RepID=UPI0037183897
MLRNAVLILCIIIFLLYGWPVFFKPLTRQELSRFTQQPKERIPKQVFIYPHVKCMESLTKQSVIVVLSQASNVERRNAIRQTWGQEEMQRKYNFSLYFIVGVEKNVDTKKLHDENVDIIQVDVKEHYYGITAKVIEAFNWVTHHCFESSYFFKVDDDVYFDLRFFKEIGRYDEHLKFKNILGFCYLSGTRPFRLISKFRVSYEDYPFRMYPPYCGGPGYLMTIDTARKIYQEMRYSKQYLLEDVYVGMLAYKQGFSVKHIDNFVYAMNMGLHDIFIECARITHNLTPELIIKLWNDQNRKGFNVNECLSLPSFLNKLFFWTW